MFWSYFPSYKRFAWTLVIGALSVGVRLQYVHEYTQHPLGRLLWVDEIVYWERACEIRNGKWLPDQPFFQDPLIHYVLAGLMRLTGDGVVRLRFALGCLGSLTPIVVYRVGARNLGSVEGVLAGLALAIYGPLVFTDAQLEKEGAGALTAAMALLVIARAAEPGRHALWAALAGCLWGLVTLLRGNALLMAPLGIVWWLICPGLPLTQRGRLIRTLAYLAGFIIPLAPVSLVNYAVSQPHEFIMTTWQGGAMFYTGNGPGVSGVGEPGFVRRDPHIEASDFAVEAERRVGRRLTPGEVSSFWMREGLKQWQDAPLASMRFLGFKLGLLLNDLEIPDSQSLVWVRLSAAPQLSLAFLSFGWLAPWVGIGLTRTRRSPFWWFLSASTVVGLGSTALFLVLGRYRIPWAPGLALLAAAGVVELARQLAARRWGQVAWRVILIATPVAALAWRPGIDPDPDRWGYFQLALFVAYVQADKVDAAIDIIDDARAANIRSEVSRAVLDPGPIQELWRATVARHWESMVKKPDSTIAQARLIRTLPEMNGLAGQLLDDAARRMPASAVAWRERGAWWLGQQHKDSSARRQALNAYRHATEDPSARITLALLTSDPRLLKIPPNTYSERLRLAQAILASRP